MRFSTKFDRWIVIALIAGAIVSLGLPTAAWLKHQLPTPVPLLTWALWIYVLLSTLPQYYDVRVDGLFIRQGVRKILIPYAEIAELQPISDSRSAAVFSIDRLLVMTSAGRTYVIAPARQNAFLTEIARRTPQLKPKGSALALPFSTPTIY